MKSIKYCNDDINCVQILKMDMTLMEKIKFLLTGILIIPYDLLK